MKKTLLLAALGLLSMAYAPGASAVDTWEAQSRDGWTITGCSQRNKDNDGPLAAIIDDDTSTFWHNQWDNPETKCPHFFIIDRGEDNKSVPFEGFSFLPRQGATEANGYVTDWRVFVTDNVSGITVCDNTEREAHTGASESDASVSNAHATLNSFLVGKTAAASGAWDMTYSGNHQERREVFATPQTGRYVIFVIDGTSNHNNSQKYANCADFKLYSIERQEYTINYLLDAQTIYSETVSGYEGMSYTGNFAAEFCSCNTDFTLGSETTLNVNVAFSKFAFNHVYRMKLRDKYVSFDGTNIANGTTNALAAEHLWYAKLAGYDEASNTLKITLHTVADNSKGIFVPGTSTSGSNSLSTTPQAFCLRQNASDNGSGFTLTHPDDANACVNDNGSKFGIWNNPNCYDDAGNRLNFLSLTDDELFFIGVAADATPEEFQANTNFKDVTVHYVGADNTDYGTYDATIHNTETFTVPAAVGTVTNEGDNYTVTLNDGVNPFKFVSARLLNRWAKSVNNGLTTVATTSADAEWLLEVPATNGIKIFSIVAGRFVAAPKDDANPTALYANAANAGVFTVVKTEYGAETFVADGIGFNIRNNNVAGWSNSDLGSRWFQVYDVDAYETNITSYSTTESDNLYRNTLLQAMSLLTEALADETYSTNPTVVEYNAAITALQQARFGQKGDKSIPELISAVTTQMEEVNKLLYVSRFNRIVANGTMLIDNGFGTEETVGIWNDAIAAIDVTQGVTAASVTAAGEALTAFVATASTQLTGTPHMQFRHPQRDDVWMGYVTEDGEIKRGAEEGYRTFTLKPADNGFYIYNEYSNAYIKHPTANNANISMVKDVNNATVYTFNVVVASKGLIGIKANGAPADLEYLHSNNAGNDVANVVRWTAFNADNSAVENSAWYLSIATEEVAATEHLNGAKAYYNSVIGRDIPKGSGLGEYTLVGADDPDAIADAVALPDDADAAEKRAAAETLLGVAYNLNMPQPGHFYRFYGTKEVDGVSVKAYMSSDPASWSWNNGTRTGHAMVEVEQGKDSNASETVYYYDGKHLVSLTDGRVVGEHNTNSRDWKNVVSTNDDANIVTFAESGAIGKYNIIANGNRYLYNRNANIDCGGSDDGEGYRWDITEVEYLPIPGSDTTYTTLCSPVALSLHSDWWTLSNVSVCTVALSGDKVVLSPLALDNYVIPANTPVVLHLPADVASRDASNNLVYLYVSGEGNAVETGLQGSYLAEAKGDKKAVVLNNGKFAAVEGDNLDGFKAYLEVEDNTKDYALTWQVLLDMMTPGKVFTIKNENVANNRGYLTYKENENRVWTSNKLGANNEQADAAALTDSNYHWTVVNDSEGNHYLYNLGAQKLIGAYGALNSQIAEFYWHFTDSEPTAIDVDFLDWGVKTTMNSAIVNFIGGSNTVNPRGRAAGMTIVNGNTTAPVGCTNNAAKDGCGFIFTEVADATLDGVTLPTPEEISAMKTAMADAHTDALDYTSGDCVYGEAVGHYTEAGFAQFKPTVNVASATDDAETRYYALVRGRIAAGDQINKIVGGHGYVVKNSDDIAYKSLFDKDSETFTVALEDRDPAVVDFNWLATYNAEGALTLSHGHEFDVEETPAVRAAGQTVTYTHNLVEGVVPAYDGMGKITLGNLGDVTMTDLGENADTTTGIAEITAEGNRGADVIFDLQGRRVSNAVKGVYIINGKKMLVK